MKRKNLFFLVIAFFATFSLASCLNDDYESKAKLPSVEELRAASHTIQGLYRGKLSRYGLNEREQLERKDSVNTTWEIKDDTTLIIKNIPTKMLTASIIDTDLKQAIEALPNQEIKCAISVFNVKPILFYIAPYRLDLGKITYGGKTHDVAIAFLFKNNYTYGGYDADRKVVGARLLEAGMVVDGVFDKSVSKGVDYFFLASEPRV
ncbi:DUF4840 domain-containing protein [Prevotella melaninogenica]|mgnify:CR=1 FL=1|uniref:DUF4840 domain-containing protein n=1 Tax=Prevotella melaninogenica TaxID=28132 RepID=A0A7D4KE74_9BACT|nr:DUF4840 domain-containing protein [Prevotella melaninogenica]EFC72705.1 hypothetical protein HMPREF0660_01662 [Prevotella melaninogenica D18]QKH89276.1 DUF4840 domain-containing protein [Prevotella melaninogenica]